MTSSEGENNQVNRGMQRFFLTFLIFIFVSCSDSVKTKSQDTHLGSKDYPSKAERIKILKELVNLPSEIKDAEFDLFNANGFTDARTTIPGTSSWNYKIAVKIDTADIKSWVDGQIPITAETSLEWPREIEGSRKKEWEYHSPSQYYIKGRELIVVHKPEGIIFMQMLTD